MTRAGKALLVHAFDTVIWINPLSPTHAPPTGTLQREEFSFFLFFFFRDLSQIETHSEMYILMRTRLHRMVMGMINACIRVLSLCFRLVAPQLQFDGNRLDHRL